VSWCCKFLCLPRGSSAAGGGPSGVGGARAMPFGAVWVGGGNGPAAGALCTDRAYRCPKPKSAGECVGSKMREISAVWWPADLLNNAGHKRNKRGPGNSSYCTCTWNSHKRPNSENLSPHCVAGSLHAPSSSQKCKTLEMPVDRIQPVHITPAAAAAGSPLSISALCSLFSVIC
jgi:hypothetical protein